MAISLYDISVASFQQSLGAVGAFLEKGKAHCESNGLDLAEIVETRLYADMLPFRFQIASVAHHTLGAVQGVQSGVFKPPAASDGLGYADLQNLVADAAAGLGEFGRDKMAGFEGKQMVFELGSNKIPFVAENFILSFSIPNLHFHATTAYDILRQKGVPLGKRDYLGQMRMGG